MSHDHDKIIKLNSVDIATSGDMAVDKCNRWQLMAPQFVGKHFFFENPATWLVV